MGNGTSMETETAFDKQETRSVEGCLKDLGLEDAARSGQVPKSTSKTPDLLL